MADGYANSLSQIFTKKKLLAESRRVNAAVSITTRGSLMFPLLISAFSRMGKIINSNGFLQKKRKSI
jgi:hypothetical protein